MGNILIEKSIESIQNDKFKILRILK